MQNCDKYLIDSLEITFVSKAKKIESLIYKKIEEFEERKTTLELIQDDNPENVEYCLKIKGMGISKARIFNGSEVVYEGLPDNELSWRPTINMEINITKAMTKLSIKYANQIMDDISFDLILRLSNALEYRTQQEELITKELQDAFKKNISHSIGNALINIYFKLYSDKVTLTKVELYKWEPQQLLAKYKVDSENYFLSISGLAFGSYGYVVIQLDNDGSIIAKSDMIRVDVTRPLAPVIHGGKPTRII